MEGERIPSGVPVTVWEHKYRAHIRSFVSLSGSGKQTMSSSRESHLSVPNSTTHNRMVVGRYPRHGY